MLEKFIYKNHMNEIITFGETNVFVNHSDLHDYSWEVISKNNKISSFKKGITSKSIPVVIMCGTEAEGLAIRNKLYEVFEKDVLVGKHGQIIVGDYYLKCYVQASQKSEYLNMKHMMNLTLTVTTDEPYWIKETMTTFNYGAGAAGKNLDYNNDFPYDYTSNLLGLQLNNTGFVPVNFRMRIYGACENPKVTIAGHEYEVAASLADNEYLTIDSIKKTIILTHTDGSITNCFNLRNKESYIFEKIPVGLNNVSNNGDFKFDVTLLEERGEPKWI